MIESGIYRLVPASDPASAGIKARPLADGLWECLTPLGSVPNCCRWWVMPIEEWDDYADPCDTPDDPDDWQSESDE